MIEGFCGRMTVTAVGSAGKRVVSDRLGISFACNGGVKCKAEVSGGVVHETRSFRES